jgi:flavin reductase (DIM6/NTAB) family NADH-FMN oxidoreductase RutF
MTDERTAVASFLRKCNAYAQASIQRKLERGETEELAKWESYIEFNNHALEEIANGTLDAWFGEEGVPPVGGHLRLPVAEMGHVERSVWLNNLLSPRPVVLAGTTNPDGSTNFAPYSSFMQVSTAPPYLTASFSIHKDGRSRDTLTNLKRSGSAVLNLLPPTPRGAYIVDETAAPLPHGEPEHAVLSLEVADEDHRLLKEAIAAIEASYVEEHALPDAVATLVVLRVEAVWFSSSTPPTSGLHLLCQHGRDEMTPAPQGWKRRVTKHYGAE